MLPVNKEEKWKPNRAVICLGSQYILDLSGTLLPTTVLLCDAVQPHACSGGDVDVLARSQMERKQK